MTARPKKKTVKKRAATTGVTGLMKELWQAAVTLRGAIEPADYKRYVLPIIFLRFLSLRYDHRRKELEGLIRERGSDGVGPIPNGWRTSSIHEIADVADDARNS